MINVLINGSNGRMGRVLEEYISTTSDIFCLYGIDKDTDLQFSNILTKPDVIIDFSSPEGTLKALDYASSHLIPIVIATTGFSEQDFKIINEYSQAIPIFISSNMSYTIHLFSKLLAEIAPFLSDTDIEILEKHHNMKCDAPSGTALLLADSINKCCENRYTYVFDRHTSKRARNKNEIGLSSIRGGNLVGEHSVFFFGDYETIEIKHSSFSRNVFAEGAIRAARFILTKRKGLFGMEDLLN